MNILFQTFADWSHEILTQSLIHLQLSISSVIIAIAIGVPIGIALTHFTQLARPVLYFLGILQTIPSLAMLGFLIPLVGIGAKPSIIALVIYSLLVIVQNTVSGIQQVEASIIESATGIGMNPMQILFKIKLPLATPIILAGVRVATVTCVGIATLVAAVGAGGLGVLIFRGLSIIDNSLILAGALPAALLAVLLDTILLAISKLLEVKR